MIYVRPFKAIDMDKIEAKEPIKRVAKEHSIRREEAGLSVTGVKGGKVVACGGVDLVEEDVGEIWLALDKNAELNKYETGYMLKEGLKVIETDYGLKRIQARVRVGFAEGQNLVEHFGFTKEYILYGKTL